MDIIIRKVKLEDAEKLVEYCNLVGGESDNLLFGSNSFHLSIEDEIQYINSITDKDTTAMFVAEYLGEIIATANIVSSNRERIKHVSEISLAVRKKYWNQGIGSKMLNKVVNFAKQNNITKVIHLGVRINNFYGIKLYEKYGFKRVGIHKKYMYINQEYHDLLLMELIL